VPFLAWSDVAGSHNYVAPIRYRFSTRDRYDVFQHDFYEFFILEEGVCRSVLAEGEVHGLDRNSAGLVAPGTPHEFVAERRRPFMLFSVLVNADYFSSLRRRYGDIDGLVREISQPRSEGMTLSNGQRSRISFGLTCLLRQPNSVFSNDLFLLNLCNELRVAASGNGPTDCPSWLHDSLVRMRQPDNLYGGVRRLAEISGRSYTHLSRTIRQHFGLSPTQLVQRMRMQHAADRLVFTNDPVIEVAAQCGYQSLSHFYHVFSDMHGATPQEYRRAGRIEPSAIPTIDS
jgi:AraC family cel operon transcriptional repressor